MVSVMVSFEQVGGCCNASTMAQPFSQGPDSETYLAGNSTDENGPLNVSACYQLEDQITDRPQASLFARLKSPYSEKCAIWIRQSWARLSQSVTRTVGMRSRAFYWVLLSERNGQFGLKYTHHPLLI